MRLDIHHYFHTGPELERQLGRIETALNTTVERLNTMALSLDRVKEEVAETTTVVASAVTLMQNLSQLIRDAAGNEAEINRIADEIDANNAALASAVAANTPAATPAPAEEPPLA